MPITLQGDEFPLPQVAVEALWQATIHHRQFGDEIVTVRCVDAATITQLNRDYRHHDTPTNVLSFSYPADPALPHSQPHHDVPLCLAVARQEAAERRRPLPDYVALLLIHAFLHITGLDHEKGSAEATMTQNFEQELLQAHGFTAASL
jgi:probable rRNA maturation factor